MSTLKIAKIFHTCAFASLERPNVFDSSIKENLHDFIERVHHQILMHVAADHGKLGASENHRPGSPFVEGRQDGIQNSPQPVGYRTRNDAPDAFFQFALLAR